MIVLDASFAFTLHLNSPPAAAAARFLAESGAAASAAPDLILAEVANAAWKTTRVGAITAQEGMTILTSVASMFTRLVPAVALAPRAYQIAIELDHPVYDCIYLALAERESAVLVTFDQRFEAAVRKTEWAALVRCLDK